MFSPLAKGNGSWDGHFDDESTFDSLFPSIYQSSIHNDGKQTTDTSGLTKTQEHALHLPKTFLTRKGAILLFAKNGKQNVYEREKPNRNDEILKGDSLVTAEEEIPQGEKRKLFLEFLEVFLKDQTTNKQTSSKPINLKENNWTSKQQQEGQEQTENVFKILSRPKSINSFYSHETQAKRQKARPNTAVPVIPNEPEQPKAHPRITSGKPRPPIRALGKLPSKNTRSEFDKEKSYFLRPPSPESHLNIVTRQLTTPNYSTTNEMVQDDRISVPRPNSECHRSGRVSRAASSMSRYSAWWAMDDVSLGYYDNELQDHEYPECIECLSEQRSEIGAMSTSDRRSDIEEDAGSTIRISTPDIENTKDTESTLKLQADNVEEENGEYFSQNWASKRDSWPQADLSKQMNASSTTGSGDLASEAFQDVWRKESYTKQPSIKNRVKSAPCLPKTNDPMFRRKAHSAGLKKPCKPTMFYSERETVATTAMENYFIRVPSAVSCDDSENDEDTISMSKDISGKPPFSEYRTGPGELVENSDIELTNQRLSTMVETSSPGLSLVTRGVEGSGYEVETKDGISDDAFENTVKIADHHVSELSTKATLQNARLRKQDITKPVKQDSRTTIQDTKSAKMNIKPAKQDTKPARQDIRLASDVVELQISEVSQTNVQAHQTLNNDVLQEQEIESTTSKITQDTEIGDGRQMENNSDIPSIVLSPEGNANSEDREDDATILQYIVREDSPVKEAEFEEKLGFGSDDDDSVISLADIETKAGEAQDSPEEHHQKDEEKVHEITESPQVDGVGSKQTTATDSDTVDIAETTESRHSNVAEIQQLPETTANTDDSKVYVREIQLLSGTNLKTDELSDKVGSRFSSKVQSFSSDTNFETDKTTANAETQNSGIIVQASNSDDTTVQSGNRTSESRDSSKPIKKQEFGDNGLADTQKVDSQSYGRKGPMAGILERKMNDKPQDKSKLYENSTTKEEGKSAKVKTEKTKREKLDIQGVGKADNMVTDTKDKVEIKLQNKVDLSDLVAKKPSNKSAKKRTSGKKAKSPKTARKSTPASEQAPEPEPSLELIPTVDEHLLKMIENPDGSLELSEETLNQFAPAEDFQDPDLLSVLEDKSIQTSDAFAPSKVKKGDRKAGKSGKKKGRVSESNVGEKDGREERKRKMAEEKAKQDEEMKLLKEREDEQTRLLEEVKQKQRIIEEERNKRLAQETEARRQEEEAEQALKEAKRKAKEEREKRREEEAERRKMEVKRKREEKRKREVEIQKREQELEKQRVDRGQRMAELQAQKERELKLERIAEEQRHDEETRRLLELEEEKREEEARIREAEEAVQQMAREREYREQMRRIAETQQAKLEKQEMERREKEEAERAAIEEERKRLEHEAQLRENEEQERVRELRQKEAVARIRAAHEASKRRAWALRRRAQNTERMANLRFTRQTQKLTEAFTFSYHVHVPREVWELPYEWNSKTKRGSFRPAKKKQNGEKKT